MQKVFYMMPMMKLELVVSCALLTVEAGISLMVFLIETFHRIQGAHLNFFFLFPFMDL